MKKLCNFIILTLIVTGCIASVSAQTQKQPLIGTRAGIGTDLSFGLAYGAGVNYLLKSKTNSLELGIILFGGSFSETSEEGIHTYDETTDVLVFALMANYLIGYTPRQSGNFFIAGAGVASVGIDWEERSATDVSLGPLLPGGGSMQSEDGSGAGTIFNLGIGHTFVGGLDIRAEVPVIVSFATYEKASTVIPTFIVTAGMRF